MFFNILIYLLNIKVVIIFFFFKSDWNVYEKNKKKQNQKLGSIYIKKKYAYMFIYKYYNYRL
jgi:hypothetical protein